MAKPLSLIAVVANSSWNIWNFRLGLLEGLQRNGFQVLIIAPRDAYSDRLESLGFHCEYIAMDSSGTSPLKDLKLIADFYKLYKTISPDAILHFTIKPNIYGGIAAALNGIACINNIAGLGTLFVRQGIVTKIAKVLYKLSLRKAAHVFFQNNDDHNEFVKSGLVDHRKCSVLPGSGIDTNKFVPLPKEKSDKVIFLLFARLLWEKGVGEYVEAARLVKKEFEHVEFQLLGFLDVQNKSRISKHHIDDWENEGLLKYLGYSDEVCNFIAAADCVVLPSYYREGVPRSLLESASMAKPIITTDNVGCRDLVDDGINGYLCKVKNANDLSLKIKKFLLLSSNERSKMGELSRAKVVSEYGEDIIINSYTESLKSII
jgi:glycosyltransferase involved in cell wall biosynthesis